jgi:hypothetical protein
VWVQDTWASDVPDTVALLPRQFAESYFSVAAMYADRRVGCLGGPNFDPHTVTAAHLRGTLGYDARLADLALQEVCVTTFPDDSQLERDEARNVTWTSNGLSEIMLKRKLEVYNISVGQRTLGFSAMFVIIVRYPLAVECFYSQVKAFITWARPYTMPSYALNNGCRALDALFRARMDLRTHIGGQGQGQGQGANCAAAAGSAHRNGVHNEDDTSSGEATEETAGSVPASNPAVDNIFGCAMTAALNDFNFLPYRVRSPDAFEMCMTYQAATPDHDGPSDRKALAASESALRFSGCVEVSGAGDERVQFSQHQLFSVFVGTTRPQRIVVFPEQNEELCLAVRQQNVDGAQPQPKPILEFTKCQHRTIEDISLLFAISAVSLHGGSQGSNVSALVDEYFSSSRWQESMSKQLDAEVSSFGAYYHGDYGRVRAAAAASSAHLQHLPDHVVAEVRWVGLNGSYCLVRGPASPARTETAGNSNNNVNSSSSTISLEYCGSAGATVASTGAGTVLPSSYFVMERVHLVAPTTY